MAALIESGRMQAAGLLNSANRNTILYRISDAKRPATRARRIRQYVDMLARGEARP